MPELPEVETARRGIAPHLEGRRITGAVIRQPRLRWPVPDLNRVAVGQSIVLVERRAKYLLLHLEQGALIVHLGMSGSLRIVPADTPARPHDHIDLCVGGECLRLHDPRRFGAVLWTPEDPYRHPLLCDLGPEPLADAFDVEHLLGATKGRRSPIKTILMDGHVVVGVGNIYATEALFMAGIHPQRAAGRVARARLQVLVAKVKQVLARAITQGGTTLRDFVQEDGNPGYFAQELLVYGRVGRPCPQCGRPLLSKQIGQRTSTYCGHCQR